MTKVEVKLEKS